MPRSHSKHIVRTTDLELAVFLRCQGHEPDLSAAEGDEVKKGHPQGAWEFEDVDSDVRMFESNQGRVEPKQFNAMLKRTRREMFSFLGIGQG